MLYWLYYVRSTVDYHHTLRLSPCQAHNGHVVSIQVNARRVLSGSRDRTALLQDFWAKMLDVGSTRRTKREEEERKKRGESRFLRRRAI